MSATLKVAQAELAARVLAKRRLLPFVQRINPRYLAGWVHQDICRRLEKFSDDVAKGLSPRLMLLMPPRAGKLIAHDTPVPTPKGWTTHGQLKVGDVVFGPDGKTTKVVAVSPEDLADMRVEFNTKEVIYCHENHDWTFHDRQSGRTLTKSTEWLRYSTWKNKPRNFIDRSGAHPRTIYQLPRVTEALLVEDHWEIPKKRPGFISITRDPQGKIGQCIQVARPDGLYIIGRTLLVTHNSELSSRMFPAWHLGRHPDHEIIACAYNVSLAMSFSRKVKEAIEDPAYKSVFDLRLNPDFKGNE